MMLGIEAQLLIIDKIKRINKIADYQKRIDEFASVRQSIISNFCDELDDMLAAVDLSKRGTEKQIVDKVTQLSIAFNEEQQMQIDYELLCDNINEAVDGLYWYDKEILMLYIELGNYRAIEKKTGIPYASAYKTVQRVIEQIKQKVLR